MAKVNVVLACVLDDGQTRREPGESVSMEEGQARKLAALGMVELPKAAASAKGKAAKNGGDSRAAKAPAAPGDLDRNGETRKEDAPPAGEGRAGYGESDDD